MENFENQNIPSENSEKIQPVSEVPYEAPKAEESTYRGMGTGRRESPYADSPYVVNRPADAQYRYQPQPGNPRPEYHYQPQPGNPRPEYRYQPQYSVPKKPKKRGGFWKKALSLVAALALVAGSCGLTAGLVNKYWDDRTEQLEKDFNRRIEALQAQIEAQAPSATGNSVSGSINVSSAGQVYAQNVKSVVLIESTVTASMYGQTTTGISAGSGFILTENGYVVTNYHVVEGATAVDVYMYDGSAHAAALVGYDDTNDVAVLKIEAEGLPAVKIGSSADLIVGDQVAAIGNPLGELTSTLTVGYVSAKERDVTTDGTVINMLQTDCAINSGNSGGPLFNMNGEVVGITTAKYSGSSSSGATIEGIGFAIPIDDVMEGIGELMEYGYIKSAYMGVIVQNMDAQTASIYGLPIGAYVAEVEQGAAAQRAGIQPKDIIIGVGDKKIESITDLTRALRDYEPGDTARITVYRGGMEKTIPVTLDERPANTDTIIEDYQPQPEQPSMPEGNYDEWYDFFAPFFGYGDGE